MLAHGWRQWSRAARVDTSSVAVPGPDAAGGRVSAVRAARHQQPLRLPHGGEHLQRVLCRHACRAAAAQECDGNGARPKASDILSRSLIRCH
jgi:hypothetical protein